MFESDKDTQAASPLPAAGDAPVPTQDGQESPALSFENKEYTAGPQARPSTPAVQPRQETAPEPKAEPKAEPKMTPQTEHSAGAARTAEAKKHSPAATGESRSSSRASNSNRLRFRSLPDISRKPASLGSAATFPIAGVPPSAPPQRPSGVTRKCSPTPSARDGTIT